MRGYKATYNYKCRGQHFEIGKTYELDEKPIMCENGFHFCTNMPDVLNYYGYIPNEFKLLEIEAVGEIVREEDKSCTNKIKILREVPMEEWGFYKVLPNGYCEIHYKGSRGYEWRKEYDENGNMIHFKDSNGYEYRYEYDENGNVIHYKHSDGFEYWKEYDENGNVIHFHYKDSDGCEGWREYDENGNVIHFKNFSRIEH